MKNLELGIERETVGMVPYREIQEQWMEAEDRVYAQYYKDVARTTMPSNAEEERELFRRYRTYGDKDARRRIVEGCLRFVIKIARQYHRGNTDFLKTLIAAGNVGLLVAVDRYMPWVITCTHCKTKTFVPHPTRQRCNQCKRSLRARDAKHYTTRFLTYAAWWISEAIRTEIYEYPLIHIPAYRQKDQFRRSHPDTQNFFYVNFDETMEDTLVSDEEGMAAHHARELLHKLLQSMRDRHAYVVIAYYGLREDPKTLREIAQKLGVCPERVRQIKVDAMTELRKKLKRVQDEIYLN